jgi:alpha-glucuronidase
MKTLLLLLASFFCSRALQAEDGYRLWLRYDKVGDSRLLDQYRRAISGIEMSATSSPVLASAREELVRGLSGLLDLKVHLLSSTQEGAILVGTPASNPAIAAVHNSVNPATLSLLTVTGDEGFVIAPLSLSGKLAGNLPGKHIYVIEGNSDRGVLYGVFEFLRILQMGQPLPDKPIRRSPAFQHRILDHWDNLNRFIERGYAGFSLWDWFKLPGYLDPRYKDYARADASVGINGVVVNNVNANPLILTPDWLAKTAALAGVFRAYGIRLYLSARFSAPIEIGGLKTADPFDPGVIEWWRRKTEEIYSYIPDFGGFLVKANSEGQPGPQNYGRTHADGANMLAAALAPHHGIVMWRAFVYSNENAEDRAKQAYDEFKPLDGKFRDNVLVQVKNGPIDFQPREPFHPLFGAMQQTHLMPEFQLTQEYLGFSTHLVYLAPLIKECLDADTWVNGQGSTVARIVTQSPLSGIAGVANTGDDINWCGHPFAAANWYAFGRLAWDPSCSSGSIAVEWIRQTFSNDQTVIEPLRKVMLASRDITVAYMTPLGLHHIMGYNHHHGPAPWFDKASRPDWNPVYYHRADKEGIGFDRSASGSNALAQYSPQARLQWEDSNACPDKWLLWFHHVSWDHRMKSGRTIWDELCFQYFSGADSVRWMQTVWSGLRGRVDDQRWQQVDMLLAMQAAESKWWRDACLLYFGTFSGKPLPSGYEKPTHDLSYYESLQFPYAPGILSR